MAVERAIEIGGKEWHMKANALVPRMYRFNFGRDMMTDILKLQKKVTEIEKAKLNDEDRNIAQFEATDLTIFENAAWCFIKAAGVEDVGKSPDEWLENLDSIFSIYEVLPTIIDLWTESTQTTSVPTKK